MIKDNIVTGAIIGTAGAVVQNLYSFALKAFGYQGLIYIDYGRALLFMDLDHGALSYGLGIIAQWIWDIIIGVIFVYMIERSSEYYLYPKGIIYGVAVWFFIEAGESLFRMPVIHKYYPGSEPFILIGAVLYGLVVAYAFKVLIKYQVRTVNAA